MRFDALPVRLAIITIVHRIQNTSNHAYAYEVEHFYLLTAPAKMAKINVLYQRCYSCSKNGKINAQHYCSMWPYHNTMLVDRWRPIAKLLNTSPAALFLHTLPRNLHTLYLHDIHHDGMELPLRTCTFSWGHRTLHAAPAPPDAPTLKTKLRALYKRVHPDLFQQHPEAQAENSRSFKLLQEYLDTAQHGGGEAGVLVPYRFVFFLHEGDQQPLPCSEDDDQQPLPCSEDDDADNGHQRTDSDTVALRRVALVLPPPARSPRVPGTLPRAALVGLKKILEVHMLCMLCFCDACERRRTLQSDWLP